MPDTARRAEIVNVVAEFLWRKSAPHLPLAKAHEVWGWMAPAQRRQWLMQGEEIVTEIEQLMAQSP